MLYTSIPVCFIVLGVALCAPERMQNEDSQDSHETQYSVDAHGPRDAQESHYALESHIAPLEKRSPHYDFGLGKRAYSYVSEYKRLPVYNFGLGKRSRPYSFGLGKRSIDDESTEEFAGEDQQPLTEIYDQYEDGSVYEEKRARPYSFGLGKRFVEDENEEKRARMYDFGLGKRLPLYSFGLGKRARSYNFGLGKRLSRQFNFGLGKRQRDMHRFNFGLGKRSDDAIIDDNDNYFEG